MSKLFKELRKLTHKEGSDNWNKAIFTLYADNKFNSDFIWDQEIEDELDQLRNLN